MRRILHLITALATAVGVSTPLVRAGGVESPVFWPEFHGPDRKNISPDKGLLRAWPEGGPARRWTYSQCGRGYSGVSIAEGMIFTAGDVDRQEMLLALDLDGRLLWRQPNGAAWRYASPGSRATPTYHDGTLYHMNPNGRLAAYEARSGNPIWAVDLKEEFDARHGIWAFAENVMVRGDKVLCMPGGSRGRVVALDRRTGKTLWANTEIAHSAAYCSAAHANYGGISQWISMTQRSVVSLDIETGKLLWSAPFVPRSPQHALTPVFHNGHVFVACGHASGGRLLKADLQTHTAATVWQHEDLDDCHSGAFHLDGRLYGAACRMGGKGFYCVDFLSGRVIKIDNSLGKVGITCADGMIFALNHRGSMFLLGITPDGFRIISRFELPRKPTNAYLAHPVVIGGTLYLRCDQELHAYDVRK